MSFMIAMALTVVLYLVTYFLLFLGYINLVCKHSDKKRSYKIPGNKGFRIFIAIVGFIISILAFIISFFPPSGLPGAGGSTIYVTLLVAGFLIVLMIPFVVYAFHVKHGKTLNADFKHIKSDNAPVGHFAVHPRARPTHHIEMHDK